MPGGVPVWPGKPPNPGGRPNGDPRLDISIVEVIGASRQGASYLHKDCMTSYSDL
jgi:hypothetical protein